MASPWVLAFAALAVIGALLVRRRFRRKQLQHRQAFIDRFRYPRHLARETLQRYPHLQPADLARVELGLKQFFRLCARADGEMVAMPSQVVDAMWHAWIVDTRGYQRFCLRAFGRFLHHTPAEAMRTPTLATRGIQRAWGLACADEGLSPKRPERVPLLFGLDRALAIPGGFYYVADCRRDGGAGQYCGSDIGCGGSGGSGEGNDGGDGGGDGGGGCGGGGD